MKRLLPVLPVFVLALLVSTSAKAANDDDWNLSFYDDCGLPKSDSIQWIEEGENKFIRFQLSDKDYGSCKSDRMERARAPYWERAELRQQKGGIAWNSKYELKFKVRFVKGFLGNRENFWQMHAKAGSICPAGPPIMIKMSEGKLVIFVRNRVSDNDRGKGQYFLSDVKLSDLIGKWQSFKLVFDTSNEPEFSLYLNDEKIFFGLLGDSKFSTISYYIQSCGELYFKFGIYRPGNESGNNHSIVDFDKINLKKIEGNIKPRWTYCWNPNGENISQDLYKVPGKCKSGHDAISLWRYDRLQRTPYCWNENGKKAYANINFCEGNDKALTRLRYRSLMSKKESSNTKPAPEIRTNYCYISELNTLTKTRVPYCANGMMVTLDEGQELVKKGRKR